MEFYIKSKNEPNFDPTKLQSESEIAQLIAQLEVIMFTRRGEVMGAPDLGCNLEDLVYELNYNISQIENEINNQIMNYVPLARKFAVEVTVEFASGVERDAVFVDILIDSQYLLQVLI
jgi:phage baseplate assembly protein W